MAMALLAANRETVKGHCESYGVDQGSTTMLLSLYAQGTLGMIKDLEHDTCSVTHDGIRRDIFFVQVQSCCMVCCSAI
jgi:hypothetical protein